MGLSARQTGTNPTGDPPGVIGGSLGANTGALFAHGMGQTPTMVVATIISNAAASANHIAWDREASDATNIKLVAAGACTFRAMCFF